VRGRFRRGRAAFERKFAQGKRRVALAELGDLLESRGEPGQLTASSQSLYGLQLIVRRSARPNEVRVIGICEAVGARARGRHHRPLLEEQDRPAGAGKRKGVRDRFDALCVRDGVPSAVEDAEPHSFLVCDAREELGAFGSRAADLEVWGTWAAERTASEQRSAQIRRAATRARDDAPRRTFEGRQAGGQHSGFVKQLQRVRVARDVQLISRSPLEGMPRVRPDLGRHAEAAQEAEGAAGNRRVDDVEVD
jgi:hypothetical protein